MAARVPGVCNKRMCVTVFFPIWACLEIMLSSRAEDFDIGVEGRESPVRRVWGREHSTQNVSRGNLAGDTRSSRKKSVDPDNRGCGLMIDVLIRYARTV